MLINIYATFLSNSDRIVASAELNRIGVSPVFAPSILTFSTFWATLLSDR